MAESSKRLTEGPIARTLIAFALPLLLGNLFQQMYNTVDSLVVGNFIGSDALAAVASSGNMIFLLVGFLQGIFVGAGVVIARYFGALDSENLRKSVHTTVAFALVAGVVLSVVGVVFSPTILRWMGTPESVMPNSVVYFRIYFAGLLSIVLYNCANGILQAVGDSRHPLYYLIFSSLVNVVLDLIFVICCGWGVAGVAIATVISQAGSAALGFTRLMRAQGDYRFVPRQLWIHGRLLKSILRTGIPSGIQNSLIALANLVVQSHINSFGAAAMAGCGTYVKLEGFAFLSIGAFAMSITTFVSQNVGARQYERAHKGARVALLICAGGGTVLSLALCASAPRLLKFFVDDPHVIQFGLDQSIVVAPFYFLAADTHCFAGILRGLGRAFVPMAVMLITWCIIRVSYLTVALRVLHNIQVLYACYPLTWLLSFVMLWFSYHRINWDHPEL